MRQPIRFTLGQEEPMERHPFQVAWEAADAEAVAACFTPDGEFHSPVIGQTLGVRGRHAIAELMRVVFDNTTNSQFTDQVTDNGRLILKYHTDFNRRPVGGLMWLDLAEDGQVRELWAYARPLNGVIAVSAVVGPGLLGRRSSVVGALARAGMLPLVAIGALVDRMGSWILRRLNRERP